MIYRVDNLPENKINPITGKKFDSSWIIFALTSSADYRTVTGSGNEGVYSIQLSKVLNEDWRFAVGDFIGYCEANGLNGILVMSEIDFEDAKRLYAGHHYDEPTLRQGEPLVLIHSTTTENWSSIQHDKMLKSWNRLKKDNAITENCPIGAQLGDLAEFSNYIMFGGGNSGEIVVSSKLSGFINMDVNAEYHTGARLYFDARHMAQDGLLIRDGVQIKVKNALPLKPYLIWAATWDKLGLESPVSTPKVFAETADKQFSIVSYYNTLIDENNDPVHDPKPLRDYMDKWDGSEFIEKMCLDEDKSVLEVGVGTGRLAIRVAPLCGEFCGIDISPKTIERAQKNLAELWNISLICGDFLSYEFDRFFDVIYSSLTFMHIEDKQRAIDKIAGLLSYAGKLVLSIDKNPSDYIDYDLRKIRIYPDKPDATAGCIKAAGLTILEQYDTELATIFVAQKDR